MAVILPMLEHTRNTLQHPLARRHRQSANSRQRRRRLPRLGDDSRLEYEPEPDLALLPALRRELHRLRRRLEGLDARYVDPAHAEALRLLDLVPVEELDHEFSSDSRGLQKSKLVIPQLKSPCGNVQW